MSDPFAFYLGRWDGDGTDPQSPLPCPNWCETPGQCRFTYFDGGTGERFHMRTFGQPGAACATVVQREHSLTIDGPSTFDAPGIAAETGQSGRDPLSSPHAARALADALHEAADFLDTVRRSSADTPDR